MIVVGGIGVAFDITWLVLLIANVATGLDKILNFVLLGFTIAILVLIFAEFRGQLKRSSSERDASGSDWDR